MENLKARAFVLSFSFLFQLSSESCRKQYFAMYAHDTGLYLHDMYYFSTAE